MTHDDEVSVPNQYAEMDSWTSDEVAAFKEEARAQELASQLRAFQGFDDSAEAMARSPRVLVAEGDSWFDYLPGTDVLDCLRRNHAYVIESLAQAGDTLENMIYGTRINRRFEPVTPSIVRVLDKLRRIRPKAFLFSGGGNDVAGDEFESYLNHTGSGLPTLRADVVADMIDVAFRKYFVDLVQKVGAASPDTHVLVHGYGYTRPTGIGVDLLFFRFAGPWLRPALARKGVVDPVVQRDTVETLIDRYNAMLQGVDQAHPTFHHIDLRGMLDPDRDWANELHLRNSAYARVADRFDQVITSRDHRGHPRPPGRPALPSTMCSASWTGSSSPPSWPTRRGGS